LDLGRITKYIYFLFQLHFIQFTKFDGFVNLTFLS
jgi:hypothetical protein